MKRGRPGTLVRIIGTPQRREALAAVLLRETSTIGVRTYPVSRLILPRRTTTVATRWGAVGVKVVDVPGAGPRWTPEYADCHRAAREHGVPVARIYEEAIRCARESGGG